MIDLLLIISFIHVEKGPQDHVVVDISIVRDFNAGNDL